ncbi:MAG TPA: hypothetical protein VF257_09520 [Solirubrobacteraceae bacterium]
MLARGRVPLLAAALALVAAAAAVVLLLRRGDDGGSRTAARAEPLAYVPAGADDAVFDLDTSAPLVGLGLEQLAPRLTGGALTAQQVRPLLGGRAVVAMGGDRTWLVFSTEAPAPRLAGGAVAAARGGVVVIARTRADVDAALTAASAPAARYARATFDKRFDGLPADASVRVAFDPRAQLAKRAPQLAATKWGRSLRDGAAVLTTSGAQLQAPFRLSADPVGLEPDDLPFATGAAAPQARGSAPLVVGVRDPARTLAFVRRAGLLPELNLVDQLPGFLKPDLNDLGASGTLTSRTLDLERLTLRVEPPDPGDWSSKLARLDALSGLAQQAGVDVDISHHDGVYDITRDGTLVVRVGVFGRAVVLSNDAEADLRAAAAAPAMATPPGAAGGLTARLLTDALAAQLPPLLSGRLGDLTAWARAEPTGLSGQVRLAVR